MRFHIIIAPSVDRTLTPSDAGEVLKELLDASSQSYSLGLQLGLSTQVVDGIHKAYSNREECILHIIQEFLKLLEPRPTWKVIVEALRSSAVNLPAMAKKIKTAYFQISGKSMCTVMYGVKWRRHRM